MIEMDGETLNVEKLAKIAKEDEQISINEATREKIRKSRKVIEELLEKDEPVYGLNTGIGELANVKLKREDLKTFSKKIVYSHAASTGEPLQKEIVRAAIASRINVLCKGVSGVRLEVVEFLIKMLNKGITPVMYPASVGASGDLGPLAQAMLVPLGEGECLCEGKRIPAKQALEKGGLKPIEYEERDGLAVINGSNLIAGLAALEIYESENLLKNAQIAAAMSFEALLGVLEQFDKKLLAMRGFNGAVEVGKNMRGLLKDSALLKGVTRVQDAYSLRSIPQVLGTLKDSIKYVKTQVEIELNGACDNPLFIPCEEGGYYCRGANFQGTPLAIPLEMLAISIATMAVMSERRINRLLNKNLSNGLPAFLIESAGLDSGIMIPQYTAAFLVNENRMLCTPTSIGSIPTAADQEDFVSMGTNTALKIRNILGNTQKVIAVEFMAAAQALDLRKKEIGSATGSAKEVIRRISPFIKEDRPLYPDIEAIEQLVNSNTIVNAVERCCPLV
ncbi:histidine ammonia-lyase [Candidatus Micrarchaeota archaeon]|nr:histidine ammonia-lyase [Candidatus Micrarchaeota archaeon]